MKIATFNINGINGRLPILLKWLSETRPDVACLQELKAEHAKFPANALEKAGYGAIWHGQRRWNGVAILARGAEPMETLRHPNRGIDEQEAVVGRLQRSPSPDSHKAERR